MESVPLDEGWDKDAHSHHFIHHSTGSPRQGKEATKRSIQTRKEKVKPSVFADGMSLHMENTKYSIKQLQVSSCHLWQRGWTWRTPCPVGYGGKWRTLHSAACTVEPGKWTAREQGGLVLLGAREPGRRDVGPRRADSATRQQALRMGHTRGVESWWRHAVYSVTWGESKQLSILKNNPVRLWMCYSVLLWQSFHSLHMPNHGAHAKNPCCAKQMLLLINRA